MKKLMIAAAIVCAAAFANAASVGWSCAGLTSCSGNFYYFFVESATVTLNGIKADVAKGKDVSGLATGSGAISDTGLASVGATASGKSLGEGTYSSFFIVFDADTVGEAEQYLDISTTQSANLTKTIGSTTAKITFSGGNQADYATTGSNWKDIETVPEPFSGTLALLGMGAIALRRKMKKAKKA